MSLVTVENLSVAYHGKTVLSRVNFGIDAGEIVTIVGPNGSGKSSLLKAILEAVEPATGRVTRAPDLRIGYVPQKLHIDQTLPLTVNRFLNLPKPVSDAERDAALARAGAASKANHKTDSTKKGELDELV